MEETDVEDGWGGGEGDECLVGVGESFGSSGPGASGSVGTARWSRPNAFDPLKMPLFPLPY